MERAYGAMFYTIGMFPRWVDFEFYNDQVHDFKYNYKTAVFYSDIVVPLLMEEVKVLSHNISMKKIVDSLHLLVCFSNCVNSDKNCVAGFVNF